MDSALDKDQPELRIFVLLPPLSCQPVIYRVRQIKVHECGKGAELELPEKAGRSQLRRASGGAKPIAGAMHPGMLAESRMTGTARRAVARIIFTN